MKRYKLRPWVKTEIVCAILELAFIAILIVLVYIFIIVGHD